MQKSAKLVVLLPPGPDTSMADFRPVAAAMEAARYVRESAAPERMCEVVVTADDELAGRETLELLGDAAGSTVEMPCNVALPLFTMHVKDVGRFCGVELVVEDDAGAPRHVLISNRHAAVRVGPKTATLPLVMAQGWNKVTVDLVDVCARAFGCGYAATRNVVLHPSCRVSACFFQARPFEDAELPAWLKTLP